MASWAANDRGKSRTVNYYPAAWRLYELSLRYPFANFSSEIVHINPEKNFVVVRARLYLGPSYEDSPKKAEAYKQGPLSELDKVETKAKARAARDFGIGTEHALDMDDAEADAVRDAPPVAATSGNGNGRKVVEADQSSNGHDALEQAIEQVKKDFEAIYPDFVKRETDTWFTTFQRTALGEVPAELGSTHVAKLREYLNKKRKPAATSGK